MTLPCRRGLDILCQCSALKAMSIALLLECGLHRVTSFQKAQCGEGRKV